MQGLNLQKKWLLLYVTHLKQVRWGIFTIRWWTFPCGLFYLGWMEYMCRYCIKSGFQSSLSWCPSRSCIHGWWYSATISLWSLCIYYMPLRYYSLSPKKRFSFKLKKGGSLSMLQCNLTEWHKMVYLYSQPMQMDGNTNKQ